MITHRKRGTLDKDDFWLHCKDSNGLNSGYDLSTTSFYMTCAQREVSIEHLRPAVQPTELLFFMYATSNVTALDGACLINVNGGFTTQTFYTFESQYVTNYLL